MQQQLFDLGTKSLFWAKLYLASLMVGLTFVTGFTAAAASERYLTRPPVVLSPDLSAPWVMQLDGRRVQKRATNMRQKVIKRRKSAAVSQKIRPVSTRSHKPRRKPVPVPSSQVSPQFLPQIINYDTNKSVGSIVIDTQRRYLYLVLGNGQARRYGVGVGKTGFEWSGVQKISRKAEWPSWRPPKEMIAREKLKGRDLPHYMEGGPANPLGARALYLGSTLYRIHGTNQPWTIGQAVSSGCIRMRNQDVVDLYERVNIGARVTVL